MCVGGVTRVPASCQVACGNEGVTRASVKGTRLPCRMRA